MKKFAVLMLSALLAAPVLAGEVSKNANASPGPGHPVSAVVVTCGGNLIGVFVTLPNGKMYRFTEKTDASEDNALKLAKAADYLIQVDVNCGETI